MKRWGIANKAQRHVMRDTKKKWKENVKQQPYRCPETVDIEDLIATRKMEELP